MHDIIVECLQRDPGRRPRTEAVAARLDELVAKPRGEALRELVDFCDGVSEGFEGRHGAPEAAAFPGCWAGLTSFLWKSIWR